MGVDSKVERGPDKPAPPNGGDELLRLAELAAAQRVIGQKGQLMLEKK